MVLAQEMLTSNLETFATQMRFEKHIFIFSDFRGSVVHA